MPTAAATAAAPALIARSRTAGRLLPRRRINTGTGTGTGTGIGFPTRTFDTSLLRSLVRDSTGFSAGNSTTLTR
jgi:hypothetical protein